MVIPIRQLTQTHKSHSVAEFLRTISIEMKKNTIPLLSSEYEELEEYH